MVTPALYRALADKGLLADLPAEVRDYLDAIHTLNGERNRRVLDQTVGIAVALNAVGIEPVALKGVAHLFAGLYADPGARVIGDIDLLVASDQLTAAVGALAAMGYREAGLDDFSYADHHHHTPLMRHGDVACVELHTEPVRQAFVSLLSAERVMRDARRLVVDGHAIRLPSLRDQIVHNIVHTQLADRHYWSGRIALRPLCDLVRLRIVHDDAVDWPEVLGAFDRAGYGSACRAWLMTAQRLMGQAPPAGFAPGLAARFACWRSGAQIRSPRLMALGESYGYHRAMIVRLRAGSISRQQLLARLLHPRAYGRYLRSFKAHQGHVD